MPALRASLAEHQLSVDGVTGELGEAARQLEQRITAGLSSASLYWVSKDMTQLALDGSHDLPEWTPAAVWPDSRGVMVWAGQLPKITSRDHGSRRLRGVAWVPVAGALMVLLLTDDDLPGSADAPLLVLDSMTLPTTASPKMMFDGSAPIPEQGPILALLGATWIMMQEPTVAERRSLEPSRKDATREERAGRSRPLVTTIDLRTLRHVSTTEPGEGKRHLSVRFLVRGHWRQQYHPSDRSRRPRFIAPYIKGPEGAPLQATEHVMVWRR